MRIAGFHKGLVAFLHEETAAQKTELFLWLPAFLAFGIALYFSLHFEPPLIFGVAAAVFALSGLATSWRHGALQTVFLAVFLVSFGFMAAQIRAITVHTPMLERETGPVNMEATIYSIEKLEPGQGSRAVLTHAVIEDLELSKTPERIRLRIKKDAGLERGQRVRALVSLTPPSPPVMPGAFDFQQYMYFQRIGAVGFAFTQPEVIVQESPSGFGEFIKDVRAAISQRVTAAIPYPESGVALALVTSERAGISEEDNEAMRDSGLTHLLSISGLHIGLFSAIVFFSVRLFLALIPGMALRQPIKKYAAVAAFGAAAFYTLVADAPIPTQRALIMTGIALLAIIVDRSPFSLRLVAFAAAVVLLCSPESLLSASFQMSFAAVSGLIAFFEWLYPYSAAWYRQAGLFRRLGLYVLGTVMTTLVASAATAPFALFHFQQIPTYSILANVLAVPLTGFVIMPAAVVALAAMPFGLEHYPLQVMGFGCAQILEIAYWFAAVPNAVWHTRSYPLGALAVLVAGVMVFILWKGRLRWAGVALVAVAIAGAAFSRSYDILVSPDFSLMLLRDEEGVFRISSRRKGKFVAEAWEKAYGLEAGSALKWPKNGGENDFFCDPHACRLELKGAAVSFLYSPYGLRQECAWADAVLAFEPVKGDCAAAVFKSRFDGYRNGAYGLWVENGAVRYTNVRRVRGQRPWTVY